MQGCLAPADVHPSTVVYQTDFGTEDGAVAAMKGVARGVASGLKLEDLTHAIAPFDIWQAAYRLCQTSPYWPRDTVFVSVVDPGVGTDRRSIVARTKSGQLFVTPDNGTLTLIADSIGIEEVRWIDEEELRLPGSHNSNTFHGRDVYSYTGALLASGQLSFEEVGEKIAADRLVSLAYEPPRVEDREGELFLVGTLPVLDPNFGNVWTNLPIEMLDEIEGRNALLIVRIHHRAELRYEDQLRLHASFGKVQQGEPLAYSNSLGNLAFALNQGNFAQTHDIKAGREWRVEVHVKRK